MSMLIQARLGTHVNKTAHRRGTLGPADKHKGEARTQRIASAYPKTHRCSYTAEPAKCAKTYRTAHRLEAHAHQHSSVRVDSISYAHDNSLLLLCSVVTN